MVAENQPLVSEGELIYGPLLLLFLFYSRATQGTQCPTMFHGAAGGTAAPHEGWG